MIKRTFHCFFLVLILLCLPGKPMAGQALILGIHPYLSAAEIVEKFTPLTEYLGKQLGRKVEIQVSKNYEDHIDKIGGSSLDIAFMGPASYIMLVQRYGQMPLLCRLEVNGKPLFEGIIITAENSNIHALSDLAGKGFAFGDPDSTMSHLVPLFMLNEAGVNVDNLRNYSFMNNHNNVALGVLAGEFDAGAVKEETYQKYKERGLKILARTPPVSEHIFVAKKTLDTETLDRLKALMKGLHRTAEGREILTSIKNGVTGLVSVEDSDYDNLRNILNTLDRGGIKP